MSAAITITLLLFAVVGFVGAGVALAVSRAHELNDVETDFGMRALMVLLSAFAAACTYAVIGVTGVFAFGGVVGWFSYVLAAHRLGVFQLVQRAEPQTFEAGSRRIA